MRRLAAALVATLATVALAASAQADPTEYGIELASATFADAQAGAHSDFTVNLKLRQDLVTGRLPSTTRDVFVELPPGLLGNPRAVPMCTTAQLISADASNPSNETGCPQDSQIGITEVQLFNELGNLLTLFEPVYNMTAHYGEPARLGFVASVVPVMIGTELRSDSDYGVTGKVEGANSVIPLLGTKMTLWDTPAAERHDGQRINPYEAFLKGGVPDTPTGKRPSGLVPVPFVSNPATCAVAQGVRFTAIPYLLPELRSEAFAPLTPNTGCELLDFNPHLTIDPTTHEAETGSGLDAELTLPTQGYENPELYGGAIQKRAEVTLPEGVTVNPSQAVGLGACSEADLGRETASSVPGEGCPESSKIGSVTAKSPLLEEAGEGSLFIAKPYENPFGSLIALYLVVKIPERGVIVKLPGKVELDPVTGRLVTTFGEAGHEIPQLPVESFNLHFRGGERTPLVTPTRCGTYASTARFTSWGGQVVTTHPIFQITSGVNGGPCQTGKPPFQPSLRAYSLNPTAGAHSPYYLRVARRDGDQYLTRLSTTFPPGVVARLAGVGRCPDAAIEAAKSKNGKAEQASPSCPQSTEIGHVLGGAGVGQVLTYTEGRLYLAGPYNGARLSVVAIVPAVAGPFDVGTIVVRLALSLDPDTGRARVDGSRSDPLPHILAGIPLRVRDIRAYVDRPEFALNPTSCDPLVTDAELWGGGLDPFSSADDSPMSLSAGFQVANCALLGFKPRLTLRLKGGTRRAAHPALRAVLRPRSGDANIEYSQVTLPRSAFVEQAHFRTICTRVQFAAAQCPAGSVYGHVRAFSPLLDEPLEGPVYLRSSSHQLPDLVLALRGIFDINVVGRVDSFEGRLRSTFAGVPDAPVSKVVLTMQGARKGLFVNSVNLCSAAQRARVRFTGHNAKLRNFNPVVMNDCGAKGATGHRSHRRSR